MSRALRSGSPRRCPLCPALVAAAAACAGACHVSDGTMVRQHGLVTAPRSARVDASAPPARLRLAGQVATEAAPGGVEDGSGANVVRHRFGMAARARLARQVDVGVELEGAAGRSATTLGGDDGADGPGGAVLSAAVTGRLSWPVSRRARVGVGLDLGVHSNLVQLDQDRDPTRDHTPLVRLAAAGGYQLGPAWLYAAAGLASQTRVPRELYLPPGDDRGHSEASGLAPTATVGTAVQIAKRTRLDLRVGGALTAELRYGPQVDVGLSLDLGGE